MAAASSGAAASGGGASVTTAGATGSTTVSSGTRVPARFENLPLTRIGVIRRGQAGRVLLSGRPLAPLGYDHFRP